MMSTRSAPTPLSVDRRVKDRVDLMGVAVDPLTLVETCDAFREFIMRRAQALAVSVNVDTWIQLRRDEAFRSTVAAADLVLVDGTPLVWVARVLGAPLPGRVSGSDFLPLFCEVAAREGYHVFLFGANPGVADRAGDVLRARHPGLTVSTYSPPFWFERDDAENRRAIDAVRRAKPDVLFVALPQPRQENWLARHREDLDVPVSMGVGSAFDFVAGRLKRAPVWMQRAGLEWSYRLMQEPGRLWKRYLLDDSRIVYHAACGLLRRNRTRNRAT